MSGKKQGKKLIDDETLVFLTKQRGEDTQISINIAMEQHITEFRYEHAERFNNWQTDELYIEQANLAEAAFLEKVHDSEKVTLLARHEEDAAAQKAIFEDQRTFNNVINEMKSLTIQCAQNKAAAERMKRAKAVLKERRAAVRNHLTRIEARQERERKSAADTQARRLKQMKLIRGVILRDVEDPEIRIILGGQDFNERTLAEENAKTDAWRAKNDKIFHAMVLAQMVINTKEIEHMREEHLVHHKYATRYCERELEIIDENEALLFEHTAKEQKLEADQKVQIDSEEDRISIMVAQGIAHQAELKVKAAANSIREAQRKEATKLKRQQNAESKQRESEFWEQEEVYLMAHLKEKNLEDKFEALKLEFLNRKHDLTSDLSGLDDMSEEEDDAQRVSESDSNIEAQRARELALLEGLKKEQRNALKKMKAIHLKIREQNRVEQQKSLKAILAARDSDIENLKMNQAKEIDQIKTNQATSKSEDDENQSNSRMYAMLPKSIAEPLKAGQKVTPKAYDHLSFLTADICGLPSLISRVSAGEVNSLMNRVFSALDEALEGWEDVNKIETISNAWTLVSGVASEGKNAKAVTANMVALGQSLIKAIRELDLAGQVVDTIHIRVGVHTGPAVAGVVDPAHPKFNVFGDAPAIANLLEATSKPMGLHISGAVYDLVKDKFECDVSESLNYISAGKTTRIPTFWVNEVVEKRKGKGGRASAQ